MTARIPAVTARTPVAALVALVGLVQALGLPPVARGAAPVPEPALVSHVYTWDSLPYIPNATGARRPVMEGPTSTLDLLNCHITTLIPGAVSGAPKLHVQDEVVIVKEGTLEAHWDAHAASGGPGSVIFLASGATTYLRNPGKVPVTYIVLYYYTPRTPKAPATPAHG